MIRCSIIVAAYPAPSRRLPLARKTASRGLSSWSRQPVGRAAPQPAGAPWKNRPRYDGVRRGAVLPQSGDAQPGDIVVTALRTFKTARDAALAALAEYNPISIRTNTELTGAVYKIPFGGYIYLSPRHNGASGDDNTPICAFCSAFYHTHAAFDPRFDNENFSPEDRAFAGSYGVPIYLATPSGAVKVYNPVTGYEGPP